MASAETIASLGTAAGTLILAVATFSSVRSGNRSARIAEQALLLGLRPVLAPSRLYDQPERVNFGDGYVCTVAGGTAAVDVANNVLYFVIPLRNVGSGLAVLDSWHIRPRESGDVNEHAPLERFRRLSRDLYVPAGDTGFWQGAIRDPDDPLRDELEDALESRSPILIELLYGDHEGGQRTISRFSLTMQRDDTWLCGVVRHWRLDGTAPR